MAFVYYVRRKATGDLYSARRGSGVASPHWGGHYEVLTRESETDALTAGWSPANAQMPNHPWTMQRIATLTMVPLSRLVPLEEPQAQPAPGPRKPPRTVIVQDWMAAMERERPGEVSKRAWDALHSVIPK